MRLPETTTALLDVLHDRLDRLLVVPSAHAILAPLLLKSRHHHADPLVHRDEQRPNHRIEELRLIPPTRPVPDGNTNTPDTRSPSSR